MPKPDFITAQFLVSTLVILIMVHVILLTVAYLIYFERKISAYIQDRIGPNRVGFDFGLPVLKPLRGMLGLGQPLADGIKFLIKEDYAPSRADKILFTLAPIASITPALIGFVVIPWGGVWNVPEFTIPLLNWQVAGGPVSVAGANVNIGIVYLLAVASLGVYGITLAGYASNSKYSFLGGLRCTAQMLAYEIPLGLSLLSMVLITGTILPGEMIAQQAQGGWYILYQPLAALLFFIAILAEANRAPFDNAEAEQELVGGYHTEYSSMRFALFFLAEYSHMITSCAFFTLVFLGGYHLPLIGWLQPADTGLFAAILKIGVFFFKVVFLICFMMVIRWSIPRLRYDQVMQMAWQAIIPIAMVHVLVTAFMVLMRWTSLPMLLGANGAMMLVLVVIQPMLPRQNSNRRTPLYGSRFSPVPGARVVTAPTDPMALEDRPYEGTAPTAH